MSDVVQFRPKLVAANEDAADGPHLSGQAVCGNCGHEWMAVAPVGIVHLDCPKCARRWGTLKNAVEPEHSWRCNCGEMLFWLTPNGAMCRRCGVITSGWADAPSPTAG